MSATKKSVVRAFIAFLIVCVGALAVPQIRRSVVYELTSSEGVQAGTIDQPYENPALREQPANDPTPTTTADIAAPIPTISSAIEGDAAAEASAAVPLPLRIAVAGDVGTGGDAEYATAASMDRIEGSHDYAALLLLGDNVYPDGDPDDVQRKVLDPFASVLDGGTRLLPVLGNHDNDDGYGDAQVEALGMPGRWYATTIANTLIVSLDSNRPDDPDQLRWLEETLATIELTWTIVQFHHPPFSGGWHGSDLAVRDAFVPLFEEYGVDLVLSGHDHDYQRIEPINGVTYVVSGAAAKLRDANLADFSAVALSTYHFVDLTITPDQIEVRAVDHDDRTFDQVTLAAS